MSHPRILILLRKNARMPRLSPFPLSPPVKGEEIFKFWKPRPWVGEVHSTRSFQKSADVIMATDVKPFDQITRPGKENSVSQGRADFPVGASKKLQP